MSNSGRSMVAGCLVHMLGANLAQPLALLLCYPAGWFFDARGMNFMNNTRPEFGHEGGENAVHFCVMSIFSD